MTSSSMFSLSRKTPMFNIFKKKSLASLLSLFVVLVDDLRKLATDKLAEAAKKEAEAAKLMASVEEFEVEAEEALAAADKIEELIGGSAVLTACAEKL